MTLQEQLAEISTPTPKDFDPEDSYSTYAQERSKKKEAEELESARKDYVEVGQSRLRKKGEAVYDEKYGGKKSSRKELEELDLDDDQDEDGDSDEDKEGGLAGLLDGGDDSEESEGEEEEEEEEEEDHPEEAEAAALPPPPRPSKPISKLSSKPSKSPTTKPLSLAQEEKAMIDSLKTAATADVEKGRSVKKQLAFCDNILEARIKLQGALNAVNSLPQTKDAINLFSDLPEEIEETLTEVNELQDELFLLREDLLKTNESIELPSKFGTSRKRQRRSEDDFDQALYLKSTLSDLTTFESTIEPFLRTTLSKWSDKVLSASGLLSSSSSKFSKSSKSATQNALAQLDHTFASPAEMERLIKRTRVDRREGGTVVGKRREGLEIAGGARGGYGEGERGTKKEKEVDEEIFDDGDWYAQVLRDLVESRLLDLDDPTMSALRLASNRSKKTKKIVDTRASKGRKIRYHVHEKMQNFMIPIDAGGWHDEQVDELFAGLLGRQIPGMMSKEERIGGDGMEVEQEHQVAVGGIRLF